MKILKWTYAFKSYASSFIVEILNFCNPELQLKDPESSQDIKFSVKIRDIHKVGKKNSIGISVLVMKIRRNIQSMYQKNAVKKNMLIYYY